MGQASAASQRPNAGTASNDDAGDPYPLCPGGGDLDEIMRSAGLQAEWHARRRAVGDARTASPRDATGRESMASDTADDKLAIGTKVPVEATINQVGVTDTQELVGVILLYGPGKSRTISVSVPRAAIRPAG